jgi:hypothetical protein
MKDAAYVAFFVFFGGNGLSLNKKVYLCAAAVLAATVLLSACRAEFIDKSDTDNTRYTSESSTVYINENSEPLSQTKYSEEKPGTNTTGSTNQTKKGTQDDNTTGAITTQVRYEEWTYVSVTGYLVTYTENPANKYIIAAGEQLGIPVDRLSATFNSKGATIFTFSSEQKSKATLTDCYIMYSKPPMKIEENIRKDGTAGNNKALADILFENALKNK